MKEARDRFLENTRSAADKGGIWLAVVLVVLFLGLVALLEWNPWDEAANQVGDPIGRGLGITHTECEDGWQVDKVNSEHLQTLTCIRKITDDDVRSFTEKYNFDRPAGTPELVLPMSGFPDGTEWVVILNEDGTFSHAYPLDTEGAEFIYIENQVPGWLD